MSGPSLHFLLVNFFVICNLLNISWSWHSSRAEDVFVKGKETDSGACRSLEPFSCDKKAAKPDDKGQSAMTTSLAVVLYDESKVLPHEKAVREFNLGEHTFSIKQDWQTLGVAAVVWDSAVVLAEYLIQNAALVRGKNVLELGSGTGLAGMVAASLGARVNVTERAEAMGHLKSTVDHNTVGKPWQISARELDWRNPVEDSNFLEPDVILGADIIYIEETFRDLLRTILALAKTRRTQVFLSCKIRYDRDLHFLNLLRDFFDVEEVLFDKDIDIKVFLALRNS